MRRHDVADSPCTSASLLPKDDDLNQRPHRSPNRFRLSASIGELPTILTERSDADRLPLNGDRLPDVADPTTRLTDRRDQKPKSPKWDRRRVAAVLIVVAVVGGLSLLGGGALMDWLARTHARSRFERSAYSEATAADGEIWLVNVNEARHRRHLHSHSESEERRDLIGLARSCGNRCWLRMRQREAQKQKTVKVWFERRPFNSYKKTYGSEKVHQIRPLVQFMEWANETTAQPSQLSPDCIYEAFVEGIDERGVVNLCEQSGGMFGTLALHDGAFIIEPIKEDEDSEGGRRRKRVADPLKPHLIYKARTQLFESPLQREDSVELSAKAADLDIRLEYDEILVPFNETEKNFNASYDHARRRRSANSWDHYVEVMVVADYKMLLYHQQNLENYILTLFSTVAAIYRHASLGASINIVVVRIVILKQERAGPRISNRAQETLQQFCAWQHTLNDRNDDALAHHDVAILLTRHDICRATNKCDTLGLAELGTMCESRKSCAIIEDNGLSAAFTIAHELGHVFNIPHDDERRCGDFMPLNKNSYHIMAPTLEYNTNPWAWSPCSAAMLSRFLDSHRSQTQCILDHPVERRYFDKIFSFPSAGILYNVNQQCQFVFGAAAEICPYMPTCRRLWCSTVYGQQMGCRTQHMPWADGTPCGQNMWCYHGQCVGIPPEQRPRVDGAWGEWQPFGSCSRTCGGGVQKGARDCDNPRPMNGGKYCIGQRERFKSCNIHECPFDEPGFRETQCADFDNKDVGIHGVPTTTRWVPKYTAISDNERCKLYCRAHDSSAFYLLRDKVKDGTPCSRKTDDICIDGTCHKAGCDHRLGSDLRRDACGVCGGDGSTCETVQGLYNEIGTFGYNEVLKIPSGSANIDISQKAHNDQKDDDNYLALRTSTGEFLLNGQYQVSVFRQQIPVQDAVLEYSGSESSVERINGTGPIRSDIYVHILSVGNLNPPHVRYKFMVPRPQAAAPRPPRPTQYYWTFGDEWSQCSAVCQGTQEQQLVCIDAHSTKPVSDQYCQMRKPEAKKRLCNVDCFVKWHVEPMSGCSVRCGAGEMQQRSTCLRIHSTTSAASREERVNERECLNAGLQRPAERVHCFADCSGHRWSYSEWSTCSASCGSSGLMRRRELCMDQYGRNVDPSHCKTLPKGAVESECNRTPCPKWAYGAWSECSRSCDGGVRIRHAVCQDGAARDLPPQMCSALQKEDREKCNENVCANWAFGQWSGCSVSCGEGAETRSAKCVDHSGKDLHEAKCDIREKIVQKVCKRTGCPAWRAGSWSSCSTSCQEGLRSRAVHCVDGDNRQLSDAHCRSQPRPSTHEPCNNGPCAFWRLGQWSKCSVSCGPGGVRTRLVECVHNQQIVDPSLCTAAPTPPGREQCRLVDCAQWLPAAWSQCSAKCGAGTQRREVKCVRGADAATNMVPDRDCTGHKPVVERRCEGTECSQPVTEIPAVYWTTGQWSQCSKQCGKGLQRRSVQCFGHGRILPDEYCRFVEREPSERSCNERPCAEWRSASWESCAATCGINIKRRRRVFCMDAETGAETEVANCDPTRRPEAEESCDLRPCARESQRAFGRWETGNWSECSSACGHGYRRRSVVCSERECEDQTRPPQFEQCNGENCGAKGSWQVGPWSHCSVTCGSDGMQQRKVWCQDPKNPLKPLNDTECDRGERPSSRRGCAAGHCETSTRPSTTTVKATNYVWTSGPWGTCSTKCGSGMQNRTVDCVEKTSRRVVSAILCDRRSRPPTSLPCRTKQCPRWFKSKWSLCSTSCGPGVRRREVYCRMGKMEKVGDHLCDLADRPDDLANCETRKCPSYRWRTTSWSKCTNPCKAGNQNRQVHCITESSKRAAASMCEQTEKAPPSSRRCPTVNCPYHWVAGPWSTCSKSCGVGVHYRRIECKLRSTDMNATIQPNEPTVLSQMCISLKKPAVAEECILNECDAEFQWSVGPWSPCSASCGSGHRRRRVRCDDKSGTRVGREKCDPAHKPAHREVCQLRNCLPTDCADIRSQNADAVDGNYSVLTAGFQLSVYCHRMNETIPRTYLNVNPKTNFAEFYGKRLAYPHSCPHNGRRNDSCECTNDGHSAAGRTEFRRIRIDLHNMKINPNDFTFASTSYGAPVAYGTAGDCYSMAECPQGEFSVDLRQTGVKMVDDLDWKDRGHRTSSQIERQWNNAHIHGKCGGYCGECGPDKFKGLVVEVDLDQRRRR